MVVAMAMASGGDDKKKTRPPAQMNGAEPLRISCVCVCVDVWMFKYLVSSVFQIVRMFGKVMVLVQVLATGEHGTVETVADGSSNRVRSTTAWLYLFDGACV